MNTYPSNDTRHWNRFKRNAFEALRRDVAVAFELMEGGRLRAELRTLRQRHHILVIADRLRRSAMEKGQALPIDLMAEAAAIFEKRGHSQRNGGSDRRTAEQDRYLGSARVRWHKLTKELGNASARSPFTGGQRRAEAAPSTEASNTVADEMRLEAILQVIDATAATSLLLSSQLQTLAHRLRPLIDQIAPKASKGEEQEE